MATRNAWAAALLLLVIPGLAAQQGVPEQPSYKTGVEVVTVDVGVIDRQGQPVRGLATNDFTVTVAGQPRRVVSAEYVEHASVQRLMSAGRDIVPVSSNCVPGVSFWATQGWLNHVARTVSEPSPTLTPRRIGRRTIAASWSPPKSSPKA